MRDALRDAQPDDLAPVCRSEAVTKAEIRYAVNVEACRTLEDLHRHTHIGAGPCDGQDCAAPAAHILCELLDWSADRTATEITRFLDARWIGKRPVLRGATLAQEEITRALYDSRWS